MGDTAGTKEIHGPVAHNEPLVSGGVHPVPIGGRARLLEPSPIDAEDDAVFAWFDRLGRLVTLTNHPPDFVAGNSHGPISFQMTSNTSEQTIISAPGVGQCIHVASLFASNSSATLTRIDFKGGAGNPVRHAAALGANGGGFEKQFKLDWKLLGDTALVAQLSVGVSLVTVTVEFYVAPI